MQAERLKILYDLVASEPHDPFNRYALAMELKQERTQEAVDILTLLVEQCPEYLATYYQLGELLTNAERYEEAINIFEKGLSLAENMEDQKTAKELQGAMQIAKDEMEEW